MDSCPSSPENPYESPSVESPSLVDSLHVQGARSRPSIFRGAIIYVAIVFIIALSEVGLPLYYQSEPSPFRVFATFGILFAMWLGQEWAIILTMFGTGIGGLFGIGCGLLYGPPLLIVTGMAYIGITICFFKSDSLNAFLMRNKISPTTNDREA